MKLFLSLSLFIASFSFASEKPEGAIQLIGPEGIKNLVNEQNPDQKLSWTFKDGVATAAKEHIVTSMPVNNFKAHVEFKVVNNPNKKKNKTRGNNGNSGVYIQQRYEIQILNSFGHDDDYQKYDCASIYKFKKPDHIVCKPEGEWQTYDIEFYAAKWQGKKKIANARLTLIHNGVKVHDNVELPNKTGHGKKESPEPLPLRLQYHSNPVQFRNVWIKEIK
ncbi:putative large multi-functional protein [Lentisphaera araneosa HTCC2155]|uniref:Putative large multi-functional protein n=1 Tax=Lentisphaera araneosa HTCC2155 TaxID=313628 RepID=A6DSM6_9BACT|nr:DUF1080 domain-containing protein [Lentisphaera araneosa]EDM25379.1 putative large multi-functional protein [Lentisphaera araneosa HTCC2155]